MADDAERERIRAMSVEDRVLLALDLGERLSRSPTKMGGPRGDR